MMASPNTEQINFADLTNFIPKEKVDTFDGHDNRVSTLAWNETSSKLASAGYDGTVRIWVFETNSQLVLDSTLVFHQSNDVFGNELQGKLIGHLAWAPSGGYLAAAMENVINIWSLKRLTSEGYKDWFIEVQKELITAMTWPKTASSKTESTSSKFKEYLLVGKIDGSVSLVSVIGGHKQIETLMNCTLSCSKSLFDFCFTTFNILF